MCQSGACHPVSADLAHADAVPPPAPVEDEPRDAAALVVLAVDDEELFAQAQRRADAPAADVGTLLDLRVRRRGVSGRVLDLEVVGTSGTAHVRGGRVRSALKLREQLFVIDREYDEAGRVSKFTFQGRGWGHGVGMCQVGAYGLARAGLSYEKILKSFYTGVSVTKLY